MDLRMKMPLQVYHLTIAAVFELHDTISKYFCETSDFGLKKWYQFEESLDIRCIPLIAREYRIVVCNVYQRKSYCNFVIVGTLLRPRIQLSGFAADCAHRKSEAI